MKKIKKIIKYLLAFSLFVFVYLGLYFFHVGEQVTRIADQLKTEIKRCPIYDVDAYPFLRCAYGKYHQVLNLADTHALRNEAMVIYTKILFEAKDSRKTKEFRNQFLHALHLMKAYELWTHQSHKSSSESVFFVPLDMLVYLRMSGGKSRIISMIEIVDKALEKEKSPDLSPHLITEFRKIQKRAPGF
jgi:hypothetical protein